MSVIYIGVDHHGAGVASLHAAVTSEVADLLIEAEIIVSGVDLHVPNQSMRATHTLAPDMTWDDLTFAIKHTEQLLTNARQMMIRKRLEGVL